MCKRRIEPGEALGSFPMSMIEQGLERAWRSHAGKTDSGTASPAPLRPWQLFQVARGDDQGPLSKWTDRPRSAYFPCGVAVGLAHAQFLPQVHLPLLSQAHLALPHAEQFIFFTSFPVRSFTDPSGHQGTVSGRRGRHVCRPAHTGRSQAVTVAGQERVGVRTEALTSAP